jgi:hypothetical protein
MRFTALHGIPLLGGFLLLSAGFAVAQSQPNTLTARDSAAGWKLLFDGSSLKGWEAHSDADDWKAEGGSLKCGGTKAGWLGTTDSFSDYVLRMEFRGTDSVNSGVFLRSQKEGQPHITGYELQIWDSQPAGWNTGSLVNSLKAEPTKIRGGEWNQYEVRAEGDHFTVVLNGKTLLDGRDSKHSEGVIGLQCQPRNPIEFRNIAIQPLKK